MNTAHDKVLAAIFAVICLILIVASYMVMRQPGLELWSFVLLVLATLVVIDINWLLKSGAHKSSQTQSSIE